jgi:glutamine cyclotransferase
MYNAIRQGLSYGNDGMIYETTGLYGESKVRRVNPQTFEVELSVDVDDMFFGEGSTYFLDSDGNGRLIGITWQEQTGFIYDAETLQKVNEFRFTTTSPGNEGWGITYDESNREFIVSDGTTYLYFWDRDTLMEKRKVAVTRLDGSDQDRLNELEFMDGLVCCNIWYSDEIICVDPATGKSVREYGKE